MACGSIAETSGVGLLAPRGTRTYTGIAPAPLPGSGSGRPKVGRLGDAEVGGAAFVPRRGVQRPPCRWCGREPARGGSGESGGFDAVPVDASWSFSSGISRTRSQWHQAGPTATRSARHDPFIEIICPVSGFGTKVVRPQISLKPRVFTPSPVALQPERITPNLRGSGSKSESVPKI